MINKLVMYKKGQISWIRYIKRKLRNKLNELIAITGPTGSGKTYFGLSMAYELDNEFEPREQVAFSFYHLMNVINNFNDPNHQLSKKKYKVCIFDEPQTSISNKEWQSKVNKLFNYLLSTFRHQYICLIFCTPYSDFIDSATQKLLHTEITCLGWNKRTKLSRTRPLILDYNPKQKKTYRHSLQVNRSGAVRKLVNWTMKIPPEKIVNSYEAMKLEFTNELNKKITRELAKDEGLLSDDKHERKKLTDIQKQTMIVVAKYKGNMKKAIKEIGKSSRTVYFHRSRAEIKGYVWEEFTEEGLYA